MSEDYFEHVSIKCFRDCIVKLRLGLLPLKGASFRNMFLNNPDKKCYCGEIEDEMHFVCTCPLYANLRAKYLMRDATLPLVNSFNDIVKCNEKSAARNLGMYVFHALRSREIILDV